MTIAGQVVALVSDTGRELVEDICRYTEGLLDDKAIMSAWKMSPAELDVIKNDPQVFEAVRCAKHRREQDGSGAREAARKAFVKAPRVLERMLDDPLTPPRGKIEAARELRAAADFAPDSTGDDDRTFTIHIDLGDDKSIKTSFPITPRPESDDIIDVTPRVIGGDDEFDRQS